MTEHLLAFNLVVHVVGGYFLNMPKFSRFANRLHHLILGFARGTNGRSKNLEA